VRYPTHASRIQLVTPPLSPDPAVTENALPERALLRYPAYRNYFIARLATNFGNQIQVVALGWQVYALTHSAYDLGLVGLFQFLPAVLLVLPAGHVADRIDRRRVSQLGVAFKLAAVLLLAWLSHHGTLSRAAVVIIATMLGTARAFEMPANSALLPTLVPRPLLPRALAMSSSASQAAVVIGPAFGGLLYGISSTVAYLVCAATFCVAMVGLSLVKVVPSPEQARAAPSAESVLAGVRYILSRRELLGAMSLDLFAVLFGGATALLPVYARDILDTGPIGVGLLRSAQAVGALTSALILMRYPLTRRIGPRMFFAVAIFGVATIVFGLSRELWLSLACLFLLGLSDMVSVVVRASLVQLGTPDAMRGRVSAVNSLFIGTSNQLGEFESGITAGLFGAVTSVVAGGAATVAIALLWTRIFPSLAKRDQFPSSPEAID
jgi:MFS family permease